MQNKDKQEVLNRIEAKAETLGSFNKTAKALDVSPGTISNIRNLNWKAINDKKWAEIAQKLGIKSDVWQIATDTRDYQHMMKLMTRIKENCSFQIVCERAGGAKTTGLKGFAQTSGLKSIYYMSAREWGSRVFMTELVDILGVSNARKKDTADQLLGKIIEHLTSELPNKPMIIIDEADKLKPGAVRNLIYLFNALEDRISVVIAGADALRKHITRGVSNSHMGYDELESRFGRTYMPMIGANRRDVEAICKVNGITEQHVINAIWEDIPTVLVTRTAGTKKMREAVVHDLRRLKKVIQKEQMKP